MALSVFEVVESSETVMKEWEYISVVWGRETEVEKDINLSA